MKPKFSVERREIARIAGVTPALVTYYFPDQSALIEAAAWPIITSYIGRVRASITAEASLLERLREVIGLFVEFNVYQGYILEYYMEHQSQQVDDGSWATILDIYKDLNTFFVEVLQSGSADVSQATRIQSALWGLCQHVARRSDAIAEETPDEKAANLAVLTDLVFDIFTKGLSLDAA